MKNRLPYFFFIFLMLMLDQASKIWISRNLPLFGQRSIIPGFFNLTHIHNRGAIFGFLSRSASPMVHYFLMSASFIALFLVLFYFFKTSAHEKFLKLSLALIMAGAMGNLIDRIFRGYVIDFLDFHFHRWHWPSFNVADASVSVGALCLIVLLIFKKM
ncbi:MAG: signal peptidase II [Candidatus Aminicenantales bacterium]